MDNARHISNLTVNTVDGELHSLMVQLAPTSHESTSARVEEVDDEVEAPCDAPATSTIYQEANNEQTVAATDDVAKPDSYVRTVSPPPPSQDRATGDTAKSKEEVLSEDEAEDDARHPLTTRDQDGPVLHQDRRRKSEYGALPFPAPKPNLRYAKLKPTPKPRLHLKKEAASDLARIKDTRDTWSDKHMDRAFDLILDADGLKTLLEDKAKVSADILAELKEEEEIHPCLNPPEELEDARNMALQFHYLRWQFHVGIFDFPPPMLSPKMVDRLSVAKLIDHAFFDFPTGLLLLARGAYERCLRTELFPGSEARSIPSSERWTISPDEHSPTLQEIRVYIQAKEEMRRDDFVEALEKYDLPAVARPSVSSTWLSTHEEEHGIYGLKSIGITDEEAAEMISEEDMAFFPPDDERPYSAGQKAAVVVDGRTSFVTPANSENEPEDVVQVVTAPNEPPIATESAVQGTPVSENDTVALADAAVAERANASTQDGEPAPTESPSTEPNLADAPSKGQVLIATTTPNEEDILEPVILRRSNRLQDRTSAAKATTGPLTDTQPFADEPIDSASCVGSMPAAGKGTAKSASAVRTAKSSARTKRGRKAPTKPEETRGTRKRARDEKDAPDTKASNDPKREPARNAVNDMVARPTKKRKMESKAEAAPAQPLRRSQRNRRH